MDLDDEELKATKNKFYNTNKLNENNIKWFKISQNGYAKTYAKDKEIIDDIKERLNSSNNYVMYVGYDDIKFLFYFIEKQQKELEELKKENNEMWSHIPRLD